MNCQGCGKTLLGSEELCSECRLRQDASSEQGSEPESPASSPAGEDPKAATPPDSEPVKTGSMQLLLALLFLSAIVFVFLLSGMITRWSAAPPVAATPEPFRWVAPLAVTAEPTAPPPTIAPSSMSAAVGEERREFSAAIALMSDDERCLEIAFLSAPVSPEAKEVLSGSSGLMRSPEVGATLVARVNFASPTKICATTELRSYVMVFVGGATGFALPQGLPRLELFRSQTWGRSQEMVALECDQFEEHSVRGVFRATAQSEGVPVQWDLPFWAPLVRSRERFCGSVVPQ